MKPIYIVIGIIFIYLLINFYLRKKSYKDKHHIKKYKLIQKMIAFLSIVLIILVISFKNLFVIPYIKQGENGIVDKALYQYLLDKADTNKDYKITKDEAKELDKYKAFSLTQINNINTLTGLEKYFHFERLYIENSTIIEVNTESFKHLKTINLSNSTVENLIIHDSNSLETINVNGSTIGNISLNQIPNLNKLTIGSSSIHDVSFNQLPNLNELLITMSSIHNLSLNNQGKTITIDYSTINNEFLMNASNLEYLYITDSNLHESIFTNTNARNLKTLDLFEMELSNYSFLTQFPHLQRLSIYSLLNNEVVVTIPEITSLLELNLAKNNELTDYHFLERFPNLNRLNVSFTKNSVLPDALYVKSLRLSLETGVDYSFLNCFVILYDITLHLDNADSNTISTLPVLNSVKELNVYHNFGSDYSYLVKYPNISKLSIREFTGNNKGFLENIININLITSLEISGQNLNYHFLTEFKNLSSLKIDHNRSTIYTLPTLSSIKELEITHNYEENNNFTYLKKFPNLYKLSIINVKGDLSDLTNQLENIHLLTNLAIDAHMVNDYHFLMDFPNLNTVEISDYDLDLPKLSQVKVIIIKDKKPY